MLIRVGGGKEGIKEYLEKGHKQGREHSRDELDERVILAGDLEFTDQLINGMETDGERYLHITLAFKEDEISHETMLNITRDFEEFAFAAYGDNEFNFYAEAHLPKIKSYINQKTGEMVERKPHIHIVVPKLNMLSGGFLNPLGMVEHNERFLDSFQEHVNNKYGLASPKDNRRVEFTNASDMIQRYKDDHFDGQNKDLKKDILNAILERKIGDYESFTNLISEFGEIRTRNAGKDNEYQNVKPEGNAKGVNLKDFVFTRAFIEMSDVDKRAKLSAEVQRKYEVEGEARRDPANVAAGLADWYSHRAMEIKYLNSGNKKLYQAYRTAGPEDRERILAEQARKFYDKYQEPRNEPERFKQNPFEHAYGFKRPDRSMGRGHDGPGAERAVGTGRAVDGRDDGPGAERPPGGPYRPSSGDRGGRGAAGAERVRGAADDLTSRRIAFAAGRQHDPFPIARGETTKTINGVRTMSSIDVAGDPTRPKVLLPDHARVQLDHGRAGGADALRRHRDSERERVGGTGRATDSAINQLSRDLGQRQQAGAAGELAEFQHIKATLDAGRLLAELSVSHGVIIDKYAVNVAADGSGRIKCGNRNLNVSDFLTKEMRLPWAESAAILREAHARQVALDPARAPRQAPSQALWRQFQDDRRGRGGQRQMLTQQLASERARRGAARQALERGRLDAQALPATQRKAALSIARMEYVTAENALKNSVRVERERFRAPVTEQYKTYLHGRASEGDDQALAELRRMSVATPGGAMAEVGSIAPAGGGAELNAMFYRGKEVRYLVHKNGDVVYSLAGRAIIQDTGDKLLMLQTDRLAIETALRLAHAKFGDVLTLTGPREFQDRTARIAAEANIQVTFQDRRLEQIRQHRVSELASERAQRAEHRELGGKFIEQQRRPVPAAPAAPKKIEQHAPSPDKKDKDRGPER
jgi:hypothetical protein